jgi:transposase
VNAEYQQRIADLEAQVAARDARIAEQGARIGAQDARIAELTALVAVLERKIAELLVELGRNSSNSNLPPSSDSPAERAKKNAQKQAAQAGKRKRGGQPNHRGTRRELLPADKVDDVVDFFPSHCEHCAASLPETQDEQPLRFQLTELPAFEPHTTEYRRHTVTCPCCSRATTAPHDASRIPGGCDPDHAAS